VVVFAKDINTLNINQITTINTRKYEWLCFAKDTKDINTTIQNQTTNMKLTNLTVLWASSVSIFGYIEDKEAESIVSKAAICYSNKSGFRKVF